MPETGEVINQTTDTTQIDANAELAQQMSIALNNGIVPQDQIVTPPAPTEEIVIETPPAITFDTLKEKFSYEKPEDAIAEIESLRQFKLNPVAAEIKFENEESKKLFEAIKGGKQKEAYAILAEQETLENFTALEINKDNAVDIIKLGMKYKYKDLSPSEIDYKYKKQFSIPKEPIQTDIESDEEFSEKHNNWKNQVADIEMDKIIEAKSYKPDLESHKSKLILPDIPSNVDEDYETWKKTQVETSKINDETVQAYKAFTPKAIETKLNFNDEPNKVAFEFQYEPTVEELAKSVELVLDPNKFYQLFINQDGTPNRKEYLEAIHFAVNRKSILTEAMKQAKNATLKSSLPDNSGAIVRQLPQGQQMSDLDAAMAAAGIRK